MKSTFKKAMMPLALVVLDAAAAFATKWESKYLYAIQSWRNNWDKLTVFFDFPIEIRKIIYTTNLIELRSTSRIPSKK